MAQLSPKIHFYDEEKIKKINPETLKLWNKYKIDMTLRELSPGSIQGYYNDLLHLWIYTYDNFGNPPITELTEDDLTEFFFYCKQQGNNSRRIRRRMSSVAAFYKFLRKKRIIQENPMEFIDRPKKDTDIVVQTFLTREQVDELKKKLEENYEKAQTRLTKHMALQYWVYAMFSLSTMARVNAISNVMWEQIDLEERVVNDVLEKEGKVVTLYFSVEVRDLLLKLRQYRDEQSIDDRGHLFVTHRGSEEYGCPRPATLHKWTKSIGRMIDIPTLHPHDWRHSGSQLMKLAGAEIQDISALLNHSGTDVTVKHYLRMDKEKIKANRDKFGL